MGIGNPLLRVPRIIIAIAAVSSASAAFAGDGETGQGQIISLSPEQKQEALESGSPQVRTSTLPLSDGGPSRQIHGEIGAMVGTGGARGIYGTTAIPLGENAGAILSFEKSRYGRGSGWIPVCADPRCRMGIIDPLP